MPKKLKVGFVLDDTLDTTDGVQQYVLTLGSWLTAQGHQVRYLVGESKRTDIEGLYSLGKNIGVRFNQNKLSIPLPVSKKRIRTILENEKFDVLHVQMPYSPLLAGAVVNSAPDETVVAGTFHILPASKLVQIATQLLGLTLWRSLLRFDAVWAVSEPAQKYMKQTFGLTGPVIPNGVDTARLRTKNRPSKQSNPKILFLGRLVERKGAAHLIRAFASINSNQARLVIAGTGPLLPQLKALAIELGVSKMVLFPGYIDESEKAALLASADIAVFPSTGGESFGIVLVEAIAAGSGVVIGGDNPGYRSVLADDRVLIDPNNTMAFAALLDTLLTDDALRKELHSTQQKRVMQFDIKTVGPKIVEMYAQALRQKG